MHSTPRKKTPLKQLLRAASDRPILAGDFNLPQINWGTLSISSYQRADSELLLDLAFCHDLTQIVKDNTLVTVVAQSVLDLVFLDGRFADYDVVLENGVSDHKLLSVLLKTDVQQPKGKKSIAYNPDFQNADDTSIIDYLAFHFDSFCSEDDVDTLWSRFKNIALHCVTAFVPLRKIVRKKNKPMNYSSAHTTKRKIRCLRRKPLRNRQTITELSSLLKTQLKEAKQKYYEDTLTNFMKSCPQQFWRYLSQTDKAQKNIVANNEVISDYATMASCYNKYFQSVYSQESKLNGCASTLSFSCMSEVEISYEGIVSLLLNMYNKKSLGPDGIPSAFLQRSAEWVARYL